jgi:hypothetical protein
MSRTPATGLVSTKSMLLASLALFALVSWWGSVGALAVPQQPRPSSPDEAAGGPADTNIIGDQQQQLEGVEAAEQYLRSPPSYEDEVELRRLILDYISRGGDPWEIPEDPRLVLISELGLGGAAGQQQAMNRPGHYGGRQEDYFKRQFSGLGNFKPKRDSDAGPSLSVVNHLDVLRQKLLLEMARRRMQKSQSQIIANTNLLRQIGKRSPKDPKH